MENVYRPEDDQNAEVIREDTSMNQPQQGPDIGAKGGAVAAYAPGATMATEAVMPFGRVSWPGIWAGFVTAMALGLWLAVIGYALFPPSVVARPGGAAALITGPGSGFYIWSAIGYLVALFIGGYIASRFGRLRGMFSAIGNGAFLWGLTFTIILALAMLGGTVLSRFVRGPSIALAGPAAAINAVANSVTGAWWFALFQLLALAAAIGGAYLGLRPEDREEQTV